jgi:hypothetical protein
MKHDETVYIVNKGIRECMSRFVSYLQLLIDVNDEKKVAETWHSECGRATNDTQVQLGRVL